MSEERLTHEMSRKIVLVIPPGGFTLLEQLPSLGLGYIAAVLENKGYEVNIIDGKLKNYSISELNDVIIKFQPDVVGITATTHDRFNAIDVIKAIRKSGDFLIVGGGRHFSRTDVDAMTQVKELDVIVRGEAEEIIVKLLDVYFRRGGFESVAGITYRNKNGDIIRNSAGTFITNLNNLPSPSWHLFDIPKYTATLEGEYSEKAIGFMSSRGCPNFCIFCDNWDRKLRRLEPKIFVNEIEFLHKKYNINAFDIWDDTFTVNRQHAIEICNEILKRELKIKWYSRARVDKVDKPLLELMKKTGCAAIGYGLESGSDRILERVGKRITVNQSREIIKLSLDLGFIVKTFFMYSLPDETMTDVKKTLDFIHELEQYGGKKLLIGKL